MYKKYTPRTEVKHKKTFGIFPRVHINSPSNSTVTQTFRLTVILFAFFCAQWTRIWSGSFSCPSQKMTRTGSLHKIFFSGKKNPGATWSWIFIKNEENLIW